MSCHSHEPTNCSLSQAEAEALVSKMIEELRGLGFRRTEALVDLLTAMMLRHLPFTLAELAEVPSLRDRDQATIYRLVTKLKEVGKVRQLNLAGRVSHYQLIVPGHHHDYLLCESCSTVTEVPLACTLAKVEEQIMAKYGWKSLRHELEFFGVCPACSSE